MSENLLNILGENNSFITSISNPEVEKMFFVVDNFVKSNYLFIEEDDKYYIKYNDIFYICGFYYGPEVLYYVRICNDKNIKNYVDYEDLKNGRVSYEQQRIKNQIDGINSTIKELEESGVSSILLKRSIHF